MKKRLIAIMMTVAMVGAMAVPCYAEEAKPELKITYIKNGQTTEDYFATWINQTYENWADKDTVELKINAIEAQDGDYLTKIKLQMQDAEQAGDIIFDDSFVVPADASAGYLADITSYLEGYDEWNAGAYIEAVKNAGVGDDGQYYGVPVSTDSRGLVANKAVLEAAGLGADWAPQTWDELLGGLRTIKEKCEGVIPYWQTVCKAGAEGTSMNSYEMLLYGTDAGNDCLYDTAEKKWVASSEGILAANNFLVTIMEEGLTGEYSELLDINEWSYAIEYLMADQLGVWLTGSWFPMNFREGGNYVWPEYADKLVFIPMPTQNGGTVTMSGGWTWAIPELSDNKDAAFAFITELMKPENYYIYTTCSGNLPVKDMSAYPEIVDQPFFQQSTEMLERALFRPKNEKYSAVSTYIAEMVETTVTGMDAQAAMDAFAANVESTVGAENIITK